MVAGLNFRADCRTCATLKCELNGKVYEWKGLWMFKAQFASNKLCIILFSENYTMHCLRIQLQITETGIIQR